MNRNLKFWMQSAATVAALIGAVGCSKDWKEASQIERANRFVQKLNQDGGPYGNDNQMVKAVTMHDGYVVVLDDRYPQTYFAIDISGYYGGDARNYLDTMDRQGGTFYNLRSNHDGTYTYYNFDGTPGPTFSAEPVSNEKDLRKIQAAVQEAKVNELSNTLMAEYGFSSPEDSARAAKTIVAYSDNMSKREMTEADLDALTTSIAGVTVSEAQKAYASGDEATMNRMLKNANEKGIGSTPEEAKEAVIKMLGNL